MEVNCEKTMNLWVADSRLRILRRCWIFVDVIVEDGEALIRFEESSSEEAPLSSSDEELTLTTCFRRCLRSRRDSSSSVSESSNPIDSPSPSAFSSSVPPALLR